MDAPGNDFGERLDSWGEIAAYLDRSHRTVYRWESKEGLPVHRHQHKKKASVFAYRSEIDAWLVKRREKGEQQSRQPPIRQMGRRSTLWPAPAVALVLLFGLAWTLKSSSRSKAQDFGRDWILVTSFNNRTGESSFDDLLKAAVERDLINSSYALVVPQQRINDILQLMQEPAGTRIDAGTGREICLRDGEISALLTGSIEKLGASYVLSARVIDPLTGSSVRSASEQADSQGEILSAIRRLSSAVASYLGETLSIIERNEQRLERVTTPSLKALQLYSEGMALAKRAPPTVEGFRQWALAEQFFREAVAEDATFASAHLFLGWAIRNKHERPGKVGFPAESLPSLQKAMDLGDTSSFAERLMIRGTYLLAHGEIDSACATFKTLADHSPSHYRGVKQAILLCETAPKRTIETPQTNHNALNGSY